MYYSLFVPSFQNFLILVQMSLFNLCFARIFIKGALRTKTIVGTYVLALSISSTEVK